MQRPEPTTPPPGRRDGLLQLAALVVVIFGLQVARAWLLPICFALLLAVLGSLPLGWLTKRGLPRPIAALCSVVVLGGAVWLLVLAFLRAVRDFGARLPDYPARLEQLLADTVAWLQTLGIAVDTRELIRSIEPTSWLGLVQQSVGGALSLLSTGGLVAIAVAFTLWESERLRERLRRAYGADWDESRAARMIADLQRYVGVKFGTSVLTGITVYLLNLLLGVESALLWGLLAFVLNFIPIIGSIVAAVPPVLLALASPELGIGIAAPLAIGYLIVNNGISNLLEPVLMGRQFGMPALVVLLALVFWGWLWGPGGMFLAVPLTIVLGTIVGARTDLSLLRALVGRTP